MNYSTKEGVIPTQQYQFNFPKLSQDLPTINLTICTKTGNYNSNIHYNKDIPMSFKIYLLEDDRAYKKLIKGQEELTYICHTKEEVETIVNFISQNIDMYVEKYWKDWVEYVSIDDTPEEYLATYDEYDLD